EGCGRESNADLARFLHIAFGSASELEYHLILARDLEYITQADFDLLTTEATGVKKMLSGLVNRIRADSR
ncbi:MAG TPA: four helix bundle protein, partial [Dehalococcoidia bacterium]|nr:four helix bundle protein [Dehalococcoidia bacterium]